MNTTGRVAIVTGAAGSGMGRSIALTLAHNGVSVVVNYLTGAERAQAVVAAIEHCGVPALAVQADVFTREGCQSLVDATLARFGRVDICVVGPGGGWHPEPPEQVSTVGALEDLQHEVAPLLCLMPLVLPGMYERGWGRLVAIAMHPHLQSPAYAYNLGKAARIQALLLAEAPAWQHGVTVNVVAPGPVGPIPTLEAAIEQSEQGPAWQQRPKVSPQDVAEGVAFLCSEAGRFLTGNVLQYRF
jgi:3-oxoacyl-[acyl-carrier protein] reductase